MKSHATAAQPHRPQWKSQWGFLLASVGSAIGLGSIWRFAYVCYENGGGAYLIPYFVALITAGIPLMIMEYGIGHRMRGSAPLAFANIHSGWEWLGWWTVTFVMFGIVLYYAVVIAWCVCYLWFAGSLAWGSDPNTFFFQEFLGSSGKPFPIDGLRGPIILALLVVWLLNWLVVFFGVERGIEKANKIFMPLLTGLILLIVLWNLTLPGAREGMWQFLRPDFSRLGDFKVWIDAYSQMFFTLSLGFGIMITYASYLPRHAEINATACITGIVDTVISIVAGLGVFGTLGYMAAQTQQPLEKVVQHGIGLAFVAYPQAISMLPQFQRLFGIVFFLALTVAGLASSISILEAFSASLIDKFGYPRKIVVSVLAVVGFLGGLPFVASSGLAWLDIVDHFLNRYGLFLASILQCVLIGWIFGAKNLRNAINPNSWFKVGRLFDLSIRWLIPGVLAYLLLNAVIEDTRSPYEGYSWLSLVLIGRDWLLITLFAAVLIAQRPWRGRATKQ